MVLLEIRHQARGCNPPLILRGVVIRKKLILSQQWNKMNQPFSITRAHLWESHSQKRCIFLYLVIEKTYIMFTLQIPNKIIGNVQGRLTLEKLGGGVICFNQGRQKLRNLRGFIHIERPMFQIFLRHTIAKRES